MAIALSHQAYCELFEEVDQTQQYCDPSDDLDITWKCPKQLGEGWVREIQLREGLSLWVENSRQYNDVIVEFPEDERPLEYLFLLSGVDCWQNFSFSAGQHTFYGSGLAPKDSCKAVAVKPFLSVEVFIQPDILRSFVGKPTEELPAALQHLLRPSDQQSYSRSGNTTPFMQSVLQQILRCPYQGVTKRVYLESKALELLALLLDQEVEIQIGNRPASVLKPGTLERIHYAREVLLQQLNNPPSIAELAKQVKLNEYTLKQGFRQVFGTAIFSYLHDYRLEQARLFFDVGEQNVIQIANTVGFASRSYFATAFRKKFGLNPKDYVIQRKNSR